MLLVGVAGCAGPGTAGADSTPAAGSPQPSATALLDATPGPTETLLPPQPDEHSEAGGLVAGFPTDLLPVPPGAQVLLSAAEPGPDGVLQVGLNLRSTQDTAGLVEAVRGPLLSAGFTEAPVATPEPALAAQTTFSRTEGSELLVLGVLDQGGQRTLTIGGTVRSTP